MTSNAIIVPLELCKISKCKPFPRRFKKTIMDHLYPGSILDMGLVGTLKSCLAQQRRLDGDESHGRTHYQQQHYSVFLPAFRVVLVPRWRFYQMLLLVFRLHSTVINVVLQRAAPHLSPKEGSSALRCSVNQRRSVRVFGSTAHDAHDGPRPPTDGRSKHRSGNSAVIDQFLAKRECLHFFSSNNWS